MKRIVFGLVILAAIAAVVVAQSPSTNSSGERAALLSPLQPVDTPPTQAEEQKSSLAHS